MAAPSRARVNPADEPRPGRVAPSGPADDAVEWAQRHGQAIPYIAAADQTPRLVWVDAGLARLWGGAASTAPDGPIDAPGLIHTDDLPRWRDAIAEAARGEEPSLTIRLIDKDGSALPVRDRPIRMPDSAAGEFGCTLVAGSWVEISRESRVAEREHLLDAIVESAGEAIVAHDQASNLLVWNHEARRVYGFSSEEIEHGAIQTLIPPDRMEEILRVAEEVRLTGEVRRLETERVRRDGTRIDVSITLSPVFAPGSREVTAIASISWDVTDKTRSRRELVARNRELEMLHDVAGRLLVAERPDGVLDEVGEAIATTTGFSLAAIQLVDPETGALRLRAGRGAPAPDGFPSRLPDAETPAGIVLQTGTPLVAHRDPAFGTSPTTAPTIRTAGIKTLACLPIDCGGRTVGVLSVATTKPREIDERLLRTLRTVASYVGFHLERRRDETALREEARISDGLARVGSALIRSLRGPHLLERLNAVIQEVLDADMAGTLLIDESDRTYRIVATSGLGVQRDEIARSLAIPTPAFSPLLQLLEEAPAVEIPRPRTALARSLLERFADPNLLAIALRRGGRLVGVQTVARARHRAWQAIDLRLARGISMLASLALEDAQLYAEAIAAEQTKSDFLATMSHELRTPLHAIIGYTDLLLDGDFGALTSSQTTPLGRVRERAGTLLALVNETLDVSRLAAGKVKLDIGPVRVAALLADLRADVADLAARRSSVELTWDVDDDSAQQVLETDRTKLRVVLVNLIRNALHYTERGSVQVGIRASDTEIVFSVLDTGAGIAPERLPRLFEMFVRGDSPAATGQRGFGLGLFIVERFTHLLGGSVTVESVLGKGSTFRVTIPRKPSPSSA